MSHLVFGKVGRLTDWAVRVPSPQLGCLSVSPSFLLPLLPPVSSLYYPASVTREAKDRFFFHLPYLASFIGGSAAWIKSVLCSITVPYPQNVMDKAKEGAYWDSVNLKCSVSVFMYGVWSLIFRLKSV